MKTFIFLFILGLLSATPALAQKKVALVKLIRGDVEVMTIGKTSKLKADEWVLEGAVVKTAEKSFVKLIFIDKSQMNVGPSSEMKIESFSGKDSGVIDLVKGKLRSQVTKDYLQQTDTVKSKLFIKTSNAVMGVRGTDFMITSNGKTSNVVLFEGEVVFNQLKDASSLSSNKLEEIVDRGVRVFPGEFSVVEPGNQPTVPSLLNVQQRETLEKNESFDADRGPSNNTSKDDSSAGKSVVPQGLSGEQVSNNSVTLTNEVAQVVTDKSPVFENGSKNPDGYVKGDIIKPANGSFLHVESGTIIPPAPDSVLDKNSNTYIAGSGNGTVARNGDYVPPKNMEITNDGKIMIAVAGTDGQMTVKEIEKPLPVIVAGTTSFVQMTNAATLPPPPGALLPPPPVNDIIGGATPTNTMFNQQPMTDLRTVNQIENVSPTTNTTINVKPAP